MISLKRNHKLAIAFCGAIAGLYLLVVALAPWLHSATPLQSTQNQAVYRKLASNSPLHGDTLYIPEIGLEVGIVEGTDASALKLGAWHRQPQNGDPEHGGNFILSAHRFQLGLTPQGTLKKSPFYTINKLSAGQKVWVDYHGKRYSYVISRRYSVKPNQTEIEARSDTPKLTLYSCTLRGSLDGREVIEAVPTGKAIAP